MNKIELGVNKIMEGVNFFWALIVLVLSSVFGRYWYLFAAFLLLNVLDWLTGWYKARHTGTENSSKGANGIIKKVGYWIVIGIAFFLAYWFNDMGAIFGVNLGFTIFFGWFVLATFMINEIRSVLENLVEIGVNVPKFIIKGLEVANDKINEAIGVDDDAKEERMEEMEDENTFNSRTR